MMAIGVDVELDSEKWRRITHGWQVENVENGMWEGVAQMEREHREVRVTCGGHRMGAGDGVACGAQGRRTDSEYGLRRMKDGDREWNAADGEQMECEECRVERRSSSM
jgi:hypothetical protein